MKNKSWLFLVLVLFSGCIFMACGGDDDEPQPEWSFLYGEWMPAGRMYYEQMIDGSRAFDRADVFFPSDIRFIFSPSGSVSVSGINEHTDLHWKNDDYTYEVKKDREGKHILQFGGFEGEFWYNTEEDALYYYLYDSRYIWDIHYVFKRPVEKGSLPIQKRDKNVELMDVSEMPEWMQKEVSGWQGKRKLYYQFKYKGNIYYERWNLNTMTASCFLENGDYVDENNSDFNFNVEWYHLYWYTTDWKKVYTPYPTN